MKRILRVLALIIVLMGIVYIPNVSAENKTVKDVGIELDTENIKEFTFDGSKYEANILVGNDAADEEKEEYLIEYGKTYTVTYPDAISFFGKKISMKIDAVFSRPEQMGTNPEPLNSIMLNNGSFKLRTRSAMGGAHTVISAKENRPRIDFKIYFIDEDGNPFKYSGLFGFADPDGSEYEMDLKDRAIYYIDAESNGGTATPDDPPFSESFYVKDNGLFWSDNNYSDEYKGPLYEFNGPIFLLELDDTSEFEFSSYPRNDTLYLPYLYALTYEFNITYKLEGCEHNPDNPRVYTSGSKVVIKNPLVKDGYRFLGWEEGNTIEAWELGDKTFTGKCEKIPPIENPKTGTYLLLLLIPLLGTFVGIYFFKRKGFNK